MMQAQAALSDAKLNRMVAAQLNKTKMCAMFARGTCRDAQCCFAHSSVELRAPPDLTKTAICRAYARGQCNNSKCKFAHGEQELRVTPTVYKTQLCNFFERGHCRKGNRCRHAHGIAELRSFQQAAMTSDKARQGGEEQSSSTSPTPPTPPTPSMISAGPEAGDAAWQPNIWPAYSHMAVLPCVPPPWTLGSPLAGGSPLEMALATPERRQQQQQFGSPLSTPEKEPMTRLQAAAACKTSEPMKVELPSFNGTESESLRAIRKAALVAGSEAGPGASTDETSPDIAAAAAVAAAQAARRHSAAANAASAAAAKFAAAASRKPQQMSHSGYPSGAPLSYVPDSDRDFHVIMRSLRSEFDFGCPTEAPPGLASIQNYSYQHMDKSNDYNPELDTPPKTPRTLRYLDTPSSPWHPAGGSYSALVA
eukprot:gnl/TRDRNA2_/TRDRNA2_194597_c0_seq1.p1 gnl/TRDRNA2_/TRDRNA2_194597_c0~~gnl/TRDRNA2_/TRDRNA2_194597_c0_seq1.p1  ORF type:complete len:422 (+),score=89.77 gnl/TRDRNA2_/TRDRNA2_194597_c0_seq1:79-1344(+)